MPPLPFARWRYLKVLFLPNLTESFEGFTVVFKPMLSAKTGVCCSMAPRLGESSPPTFAS